MKKILLFTVILLLLIASVSAVRQTNKSNLDVRLKKIELQDNKKKLEQLNHSKTTTEKQLEKEQQERQQLEKRNKELEAQVQAKAQIKAQRGAVASAATIPGGGGPDKEFIYHHESGNSPSAKNSIGCYGIGQSCDNGALERSCGPNYACQDAYFTNYMLKRYGSWANARAFWEVNRWW